MRLSRRDFVKGIGASAAALSVGTALRPQPAAAETAASPMPRKMEADIQRRLEASGGTDPLVAKTVQIAQNMEPVIPHDDQAAVARKKQADLEKKTGKKPNILIFLMDEWAGAIQAAMAAASWPARPHRTWTAWPQRG